MYCDFQHNEHFTLCYYYSKALSAKILEQIRLDKWNDHIGCTCIGAAYKIALWSVQVELAGLQTQ